MINVLIIQPPETNWYLSNKRISLELVYLLYKIFNEAKYNSNGHDFVNLLIFKPPLVQSYNFLLNCVFIRNLHNMKCLLVEKFWWYEFDRVKCKNGAYESSFRLFLTINKPKKKYNYLFYSSGRLVLKLRIY